MPTGFDIPFLQLFISIFIENAKKLHPQPNFQSALKSECNLHPQPKLYCHGYLQRTLPLLNQTRSPPPTTEYNSTPYQLQVDHVNCIDFIKMKAHMYKSDILQDAY